MKFIFVCLMMISIGLFAFAENHPHSETVCSESNPKVCGHLGFLTPLRSDVEAQFYAHVMVPQSIEISDFKLDLWMGENGHGHGSSPVTMSRVGLNKYKITNAWFVMPGSWQVRMTFKLENEEHRMVIPVQVD